MITITAQPKKLLSFGREIGPVLNEENKGRAPRDINRDTFHVSWEIQDESPKQGDNDSTT
jgi:hypothetical protein